MLYKDIKELVTPRITVDIEEFNKVLGGGVVPGSVVLIGGEPGIGKSTLLLQVSRSLAQAGESVLYVSGEESLEQVKLRGDRLGVRDGALYLLSETALERIVAQAERLRPKALVVDSVQTVFSAKMSSSPGTISQVREVANQVFRFAKRNQIPAFLVGHITKEGSLAGPKSLEHMVDVVLLFEGERDHSHRVLRALKNRFGPVSELAVFEMTAAGLQPIAEPLGLFPPGAAPRGARQRRGVHDQGDAAAPRRDPGPRLLDPLRREPAADEHRGRPLPDLHAPGPRREEARLRVRRARTSTSTSPAA